MKTNSDLEANLEPGDISFLAQLVAPDVQPLVVPPDREHRLREAGLVMWLHDSLVPTPQGVRFIHERIQRRLSETVGSPDHPTARDS